MNNTTTNFEADFSALTDQDMFALAQEMNMIEPGAGTETVSLGATLIEAAPSIETAAIIGFFCLGVMLVYPVARKMRLARLIRLNL